MPAVVTVRRCVRSYLAHLATLSSPSLPSYRSQLQPFASRWGRTPAVAIGVRHVTSWLDGMAPWSPGTKATAWGRVKCCWAWCHTEGLLSVNVLAGVRRPARYRRSCRGAECVIPPALLRLLLRTATGPWRDLLLALARTGARPGELTHATARHYHPDWHAIVHRGDETEGYRWKNAGKKQSGQRDRVIYVEGEVEKVVRRNASRGSYLLPHPLGGRWDNGRIKAARIDLLAMPAVRAWLDRHGHDARRVVLYSLRHTWITRALEKGTPLVVVADLVGTSATMIERHYSHVGGDRQAMRKAYLASL